MSSGRHMLLHSTTDSGLIHTISAWQAEVAADAARWMRARHSDELPAVLGDVFTPAQAQQAGISWGRLARHREVAAPFSGVRIRMRRADTAQAPCAAWARIARQHAQAYAVVMPEHAFISHTTALAVHRLPTPRWRAGAVPDPTVVEASVPAPFRSLRAARVVSHQLRPTLCHVTTVDGVRVASPASLWAMLARTLTVHELVALGDAIVRRPRRPRHPLREAPPAKGTLNQLKAAMDAGPRAGVAKLRAAYPLIRQGSSSVLESDQRLLMLRGGLPEPVLDHDVYSETGRFLGCSEIAYPRLRLAIECEGDQHRTDKRQWDRDIEKYQAYAEAGWVVLRMTDRLVHVDPQENLRQIRTMMARAGWQPGLPM